MRAHQIPAAGEFFALEAELELALAIALLRITLRYPHAAIPDDHIARAVMPGRNGALERGIFQRVILHMHCQPAHARVKAGALGDRPALQRAIQLQAKVVMQPRGVVLLDAVLQALDLA